MGKFDGILLCTDLDDTLLTDDKQVSEENKKAIEYFKSEGGSFTFATGRVPVGVKPVFEMIEPNVPMVCFNGAGIYDVKENKLMSVKTLDKEAVKCIEYVDEMFDFLGIEVCTKDEIYFCKVNDKVRKHQADEKLPDNFKDYHDIDDVWMKALFLVEEEQVDLIRQALLNSPFADKYEFMQSDPCYYEVLPKNASKGDGMMELADILGIDRKRTIGIGDNENDLKLVQKAGVGVAVANAVASVKQSASVITLDNNSNAVATIIYAIEDGKIKFD